MNEWKKRGKFNDFFIDFEKMEQIMDKLIKNMFDEKELRQNKEPMIMGFSVKIDEKGKPRIQEFGNIKANPKKTIVKKTREPLVDVIESDKEVTITAELPGVEKRDIDLKTEKNKITIAVERPRQFYKEIYLDYNILPKTAKASLKNGILEIAVKKSKKRKKGSIEIVEKN